MNCRRFIAFPRFQDHAEASIITPGGSRWPRATSVLQLSSGARPAWGLVLTRETIIDRVWGPHYVGDTKTLDVHIKRLRTKVEDDPSKPIRITTIRGLGYRYEKPASAHSR